ncbi:MAG: hypothetical protein DRI30_05785 [Chloroflexi bacterium]|nr:MAG: hypothetical protein DRI30_05785 [Chloroflexota bacterium]
MSGGDMAATNILSQIITATLPGLSKKEKAFNKSQLAAYNAYDTAFTKSQARRALIPSLPDPDDMRVVERKKAARKRMRGVLGTMLTKSDPLSTARKKLGGSPTTATPGAS